MTVPRIRAGDAARWPAAGLLALGKLPFCAQASDAPAAPGAYVLAIELAAATTVRIKGRPTGMLGPGCYLYCGSARGPGGLRARLARHMRRRKAVHWHVDQLTTRGRVLGAWIALDRTECDLATDLVADLAAWLPRLAVPITGFGSADCRRCRSHLVCAQV